MSYPSFDEVNELRAAFMDAALEHWLHDDLGSWQWWVLLGAAVLPWLLWKRYVDEGRVLEVFIYALLFGIAATALDVFGVDFMLWSYPHKLFSIIPPLFPADLTMIPVTYSLMYQWTKGSRKRYWLGSIGLAALYSYVIEPLFILAGMYQIHKFSHTYSFIGFIALSWFIRWLTSKVLQLQK